MQNSNSIQPNENKETYEEFMDSMAFEFSFNYFKGSFGDKDIKTKKGLHQLIEDIFENREFVDNNTNNKNPTDRVRNILLIGSGASYDAYPSIPLGMQLLDQIKTNYWFTFKDDNSPTGKRYRTESEKLKLIRNVDELDFETTLSLISSFVDEYDIREEIIKKCGYRHCPSLFYEIVAHMFKHHCLDVIINFNFDELLDQAIEEENVVDDYNYVVSDDDCPKITDATTDGRIKIPMYIKPHGTFSQPCSLKFT